MASKFQFCPLPDSEPHIYGDRSYLLAHYGLSKLKGVDLEWYIENSQNEGRSAHAAIINYDYLDGPALDIYVGKRTSDIGATTSKELSDIEDSHSTDDANSTVSDWGCGSPAVRVSDNVRHVIKSSPVPQKTCRVGQQSTLNLSRAETSSPWCGS
ncbi:hypothetical protein TNCV_3759501 [Trichonephila clavipes]|nr:hypothetical protein TNCV_3759501 [Trichonephila clavipes]